MRRRAARKPAVPVHAGYGLTKDGALTGDRLLANLTHLGFHARRHGADGGAVLDADADSLPPRGLLVAFAAKKGAYGEALKALGAPRHIVRSRGFRPNPRRIVRHVVDRLATRGFCAHLDPETDAVLVTDMTGRRRDLSLVMPIAEIFDALADGLEADPMLLPRTRVTPPPRLPRRARIAMEDDDRSGDSGGNEEWEERRAEKEQALRVWFEAWSEQTPGAFEHWLKHNPILDLQRWVREAGGYHKVNHEAFARERDDWNARYLARHAKLRP
jgi:hypothetical protein